eukprot:766972-Rhodomonas_salina.1
MAPSPISHNSCCSKAESNADLLPRRLEDGLLLRDAKTTFALQPAGICDWSGMKRALTNSRVPHTGTGNPSTRVPGNNNIVQVSFAAHPLQHQSTSGSNYYPPGTRVPLGIPSRTFQSCV